MNRTEKKHAFLHERILAWAAAFLLAMFLSFCVMSTLFLQGLTSAGLHAATLADASLLDEQTASIDAYIDLLAEEYGFAPEGVKAAVSREDLKEYNLKTAAWWSKVLTEGDSGNVPRWYSAAVEEAVLAAMESADSTQEDPRTVAAVLSEKIDRTVFPFRETLLTKGFDLVNERADIAGIIRSLRKLPLLFLTFSVLAAGLIALFTGREIFIGLKYYGTALAGAALVMVTAGLTLLVMQLRTMVAQASVRLAGEFGSLMRTLCLEAGAAVLVLLAGGFFCLYLYRNRCEKHLGKGAEQTA